MKINKLLSITLLFAACAAGETLTQEEREKAIRHLNQTREAFLASIKDLSPAQWNFKPAPEVWSVGQVAEHITISEATILDLVQKKILAAPVDPQQVAEAKGKDAPSSPNDSGSQPEVQGARVSGAHQPLEPVTNPGRLH